MDKEQDSGRDRRNGEEKGTQTNVKRDDKQDEAKKVENTTKEGIG